MSGSAENMRRNPCSRPSTTCKRNHEPQSFSGRRRSQRDLSRESEGSKTSRNHPRAWRRSTRGAFSSSPSGAPFDFMRRCAPILWRHPAKSNGAVRPARMSCFEPPSASDDASRRCVAHLDGTESLDNKQNHSMPMLELEADTFPTPRNIPAGRPVRNPRWRLPPSRRHAPSVPGRPWR